MEDPAAEAENVTSVWDRLRARLEEMRVALEQQGGPEARAQLRSARAKLLRQRAAAAEATSAPLLFLAFSKGRKRYGIPVEHVLEVQALEQFSPVPGAPAAIIGVVHWRGAVLALLDLSRLFEVAEAGLSDLHAYVVVEAEGKRLAVAASRVEDILAVPVDRLIIAPDLPHRIAPEWVSGVHEENRLLLNMAEICSSLGQSRNK